MKRIKKTTFFLNCFYAISIALFLLNELTNFEIKSQFLKSAIYLVGVLLVTPILLLWNIIFLKPIRMKLLGLILPLSMLALLVVINPLKLLFSSMAWQTETVLYKNKHFPFAKIEYQTQDKGAFGFNRRTVKVSYITPAFMIVSFPPTDIDKKPEWQKIDKEIN